MTEGQKILLIGLALGYVALGCLIAVQVVALRSKKDSWSNLWRNKRLTIDAVLKWPSYLDFGIWWTMKGTIKVMKEREIR